MNTSLSDQAEQIIRNHVWFSTLPGFMPVAVLDVVAISAVQVDMIKQLCKLYDKPYDEQRGKAVTTSLFSTIVGRMPGYALRSGLKAIPVVGWLLGGVSLAVFAGASTYATGMVFKEHFEQGGALNDIDPNSFAEFYRKQFENGREMIRKMWGTGKKA